MIIMKLLFMNNLLQNLFFTETNSHHTVQIFRSFICYETNITYFRIHPQFRAKKYLFQMNAQFRAKPGFVLIRKLCEISCKNAKFLRKIIYCFVETLLGPDNDYKDTVVKRSCFSVNLGSI